MPEKKKVQRKFVSADNREEITPPEGADVRKATEMLTGEPARSEGGKHSAKKQTGKRVFAVILWLLAVAAEALAILVLTYKVIVPDKYFMYFIIGAIALDLIFLVIGSLLWKSANHADPVSSKNKVKFFLWNQMGLIAAIVAFLPVIIILLSNKKIDKKNKTILTVVAIVALVLGGALSVDYNPVSRESFEQQAAANAQQLGASSDSVYWTEWGKSYHLNPNCQALQNSETVINGTLQQAFDAHRLDPCDFCALPAADESSSDGN